MPRHRGCRVRLLPGCGRARGPPDVARRRFPLVTFSGDKLLGGPQAGIIAGRADLVGASARHPLARVLRPGRLALTALQQTLLAYAHRDILRCPCGQWQ